MAKVPIFTASQFTPTQYDTAEQKARFANHFVRFVESGFKETLFYDWFYKRLSMTFGHIAHYNRGGFYVTFFKTDQGKLDFLIQTLNAGGFGSPEFTYSDVEQALKVWVAQNGLATRLKDQINADGEAAERAEYARLKAKFEGSAPSKVACTCAMNADGSDDLPYDADCPKHGEASV